MQRTKGASGGFGAFGTGAFGEEVASIGLPTTSSVKIGMSEQGAAALADLARDNHEMQVCALPSH